MRELRHLHEGDSKLKRADAVTAKMLAVALCGRDVALHVPKHCLNLSAPR